ncbi:MAG: hypothetical protein AAGA63_03360 [Pseudomonadota bacterium]
MTFPEDVSTFLEEQYRGYNRVLEYGSGGSTILAARLSRKRLVSVESDETWCSELGQYLWINYPLARIRLLHADIGPTGEWGYPLDASRSGDFVNYPFAPWVQYPKWSPELILIDGRFRVACFVTCLAHIKGPTKILFDDYTNRPEYHVVERLLSPVEFHGRMAVFHATANLLTEDDRNAFEEYYREPR